MLVTTTDGFLMIASRLTVKELDCHIFSLSFLGTRCLVNGWLSIVLRMNAELMVATFCVADTTMKLEFGSRISIQGIARQNIVLLAASLNAIASRRGSLIVASTHSQNSIWICGSRSKPCCMAHICANSTRLTLFKSTAINLQLHQFQQVRVS